MRFLIIGKARTGTTALTYIIRKACLAQKVIFEPKSLDVLRKTSQTKETNEVIKIIFEHFNGQYDDLNSLIHGELKFPVEKVIFIFRDVRDEMISRLLYLSKVLRQKNYPETSWRQWILMLEKKEKNPLSLSFFDLCSIFLDIFSINAWDHVVSGPLHYSVMLEKFAKDITTRDKFILRYEEMIDGKLENLERYIGYQVDRNLKNLNLKKLSYTRRSASYGNWKTFFTEKDVEILNPLVVGKLGQEYYTDWELTTASHLDPRHYSSYVERMALGNPRRELIDRWGKTMLSLLRRQRHRRWW